MVDEKNPIEFDDLELQGHLAVLLIKAPLTTSPQTFVQIDPELLNSHYWCTMVCKQSLLKVDCHDLQSHFVVLLMSASPDIHLMYPVTLEGIKPFS